MFTNVTIGDKHLYNDFGLVLKSKTISPPKPKLKTIGIPMRDGDLDISDNLTGDIKFENREITLSLMYMGSIANWSGISSEVQNYLNGKRLRVIFDDDKEFYYIGRVTVTGFATTRPVADFTIKIDAEPYKYDVHSTSEQWEWDSFDLENGIINEVDNITVDGTTTVSLYGRRKRVYPTITVSSAMTLVYNNISYSLPQGTTKVYDALLTEGENLLTFTGNGTAKIDYVGGSL